LSKSSCKRGHTKDSDTSDEGGPAAYPITQVTRHGAAQDHSAESHCEYRTERVSAQMPITNERGNGKPEDLNIESIKNDGDRNVCFAFALSPSRRGRVVSMEMLSLLTGQGLD
jgi:hypothetical protein